MRKEVIFGHLPSSICGALKIDFERFDTNVSKTDNIGYQKNDSRNGNPDNTNVFYFTVDVGEEEEEPQEEEEEKDSEEEEEEEELFDDGETATARSGTPESTRSRFSSGGAPSLDARAQLARDLLALKGTELAFVMSMLEQECPNAIETDEQIPRHLELNLDKMTPQVFARIAQYASEQASGRKRGVTADDIKLDDVSGKRRRKR